MNTQTQVQMGIVGCGVMGEVFVRAAKAIPSVRVVAVADVAEAAARSLADRFGIQRVYTDAKAMFADSEVDAVVLALPAKFRTELAIRAFQAGKHVLTEKPAACNTEEVSRLLEAKGQRIAGCTSSRTRLLDSALVVAEVLARGDLGSLRILRSRWQTNVKPKPEVLPPLWRFSKEVNGGGNLANLGTYMLDYFLGVTGWQLTPRTVLARTWTIPDLFSDHVPAGSDGESLTSALVTFEEGPVWTIEQGEYYVSKPVSDYEIIGTDGTLSFSVVPGESRVVLHRMVGGNVEEQVLWEGTERFSTAHERVLADFADAVLQGRPPKTSLEQAWIVQRLIDCIYASQETDGPVDFQTHRK